MNYPESQAIKQKINSSNKILVNMHHNPDADSVGSAVAVARVLKHFGKEAKIVCPTAVPKNLQFLLEGENYEVVDFSKFDTREYDLFITCDSSGWSRVAGGHDISKPEMFFINIDHHISNQKFGDINLVVSDAAANCEVLFYLFTDWEVGLENVAESLLAGIIGDTGAFRFPEADERTFEAATELMKYAVKNKIIFNLYQSFEESHIQIWKEIMNNLEVDSEHKFVYSFVRKEILEKYGKPFNAKSELADMIFQSIEGTDFGMVGAEDTGYISVSFRSRTGVDVSKLASALGGGGHEWASAARIDILDSDYGKTVEYIIKETREFTKKLQD
jgi:phosphoesterase RecJ-like protein